MQRWKATKKQYPLADYACTMWSHHTEAAGINRIVNRLPTHPLFSPKGIGFHLSLWKTWIVTQRAEIWENQMTQAINVCKAAMRSSRVCFRGRGFWDFRQSMRRAWTLTSTDAAESHQSPKWLPSLHDIRDSSTKSDDCEEIHLPIALMLIEIARQKSRFSDFGVQDKVKVLRETRASGIAMQILLSGLPDHVQEVIQ